MIAYVLTAGDDETRETRADIIDDSKENRDEPLAKPSNTATVASIMRAVNETTKCAVTKAMWYLLVSREVYGTRLGLAIVNGQFARMIVAKCGTLLIEQYYDTPIDNEQSTPLSTPIKIADLVASEAFWHNGLANDCSNQFDKYLLSRRRLMYFHQVAACIAATTDLSVMGQSEYPVPLQVPVFDASSDKEGLLLSRRSEQPFAHPVDTNIATASHSWPEQLTADFFSTKAKKNIAASRKRSSQPEDVSRPAKVRTPGTKRRGESSRTDRHVDTLATDDESTPWLLPSESPSNLPALGGPLAPFEMTLDHAATSDPSTSASSDPGLLGDESPSLEAQIPSIFDPSPSAATDLSASGPNASLLNVSASQSSEPSVLPSPSDRLALEAIPPSESSLYSPALRRSSIGSVDSNDSDNSCPSVEIGRGYNQSHSIYSGRSFTCVEYMDELDERESQLGSLSFDSRFLESPVISPLSEGSIAGSDIAAPLTDVRSSAVLADRPLSPNSVSYQLEAWDSFHLSSDTSSDYHQPETVLPPSSVSSGVELIESSLVAETNRDERQFGHATQEEQEERLCFQNAIQVVFPKSTILLVSAEAMDDEIGRLMKEGANV